MKREKISQAVGNISTRHIQEAGCYTVTKKPVRWVWRWKTTAVAAVALCCMLSVCFYMPMAASSVKGYFRDIVRWWDGAVTGVEYENAAQEINIEASAVVIRDGKLMIPLKVRFMEMETKEPYHYLEGGEIALGDYQILDDDGNGLYTACGMQPAAGQCKNKTAEWMQPAGVETLSKGKTYRLVITSIYGLQKAEQPVKIKGHWECAIHIGS